jgi:hypothetical protein
VKEFAINIGAPSRRGNKSTLVTRISLEAASSAAPSASAGPPASALLELLLRLMTSECAHGHLRLLALGWLLSERCLLKTGLHHFK